VSISVVSAIAAERGGAARGTMRQLDRRRNHAQCRTHRGNARRGLDRSSLNDPSAGRRLLLRRRRIPHHAARHRARQATGEPMAWSSGILDITGNVDVARTRQLTDLARPLAVTFHCAFDMSGYMFRALEDLCPAGIDRVLTSRGEPASLEGQKTIAQLVRKAAGRIIVMPAAASSQKTRAVSSTAPASRKFT